MDRRKEKNGAAPIFEIFSTGAKRKLSWVDRFADFLTRFFGTAWFLVLNIFVFVLWIFINLGEGIGGRPFDQFPFNLLTMVVSLEAIVLSIIVLMSQNRASHIADIREEMDFEVNVQAEREITKVLNLLDNIQHQLGVAHIDDPELKRMKQRLDIKRIEREVRKRMDQD